MGIHSSRLHADIEAHLHKQKERKSDVNDLKAHEAKIERRQRMTFLYLVCAFIVSFAATTRGFFLMAEASGATDFMAMVFATMVSIVAAVLMAGACGMLLGIASELGETS